MSTRSFAQVFNVPDESVLETRLTGYEGPTPNGDHVITYERINPATNEVHYVGRALFFRNNNVADIQVDEMGRLAGDYILSRDGKWITTKGSGIDTTGFGPQKVSK
jgi:hypothetical protein